MSESLKSYLLFMGVMVTLPLLLTLERSITALYFGGKWELVYIPAGGSIILLIMLVMGSIAIWRANEPDKPAEARTEKWQLMSSAASLLLIVFILPSWWEHLHQTQIAPALKIAYTSLTLIYCLVSVMQFRFVLLRWQKVRKATIPI